MGFKILAAIYIIAFAQLTLGSPTEENAETTTTTERSDIKLEQDKENILEKESTEMETLLLETLMNNYDKKIIPSNLTVKFGVALVTFDVIEDKNTIDTQIWKRYVWNDLRLKWDEENFGGIKVLRVPPSILWTPDIVLYNSADYLTMSSACMDSNALIYPSGEVLWVPPCKMQALCDINDLNLIDKPFGEQKCFLKFGSWTFDGFVMDMKLYNDNPSLDMADYWENRKWKILSNTAKVNRKFYDCCPEPYLDITYNITFQRKYSGSNNCLH